VRTLAGKKALKKVKRKRHTPEQIIRTLRDAQGDLAAGLEIGQICQKLGVCEAILKEVVEGNR